jgi:dTDP-4-amino-4,6-dideoxygalactose transaminase
MQLSSKYKDFYQTEINEMSLRNVPFFDYPYIWKSRENEFIEVIRNAGRRGAFIAQEDLAEFEKKLAAFVGSKYAIGVGNATDGLQLALMAGGIKQGDEVIICSHTMIATATAVHFAGGIPVPVDAGWDHLINPDAIKAAITEKTRAVMPTQLNGRTAEMDAILQICERNGLLLFEDSAQALGSKFKGKNAGTFGLASCISFYPAKVLGCFGDGGAVLTNDEETYRKVLRLRDFGKSDNGDVVIWGLNSRLDNIQAAILNLQLKDYSKRISRRREIASKYHEKLMEIEELVLPPGIDDDQNHFDIFQNYEIEAQRRDDLKAYLGERGIGTLVQWGGKAVHEMKKLGFTQSLPYTEKLFTRLLMLPMNASLTDEDVNYICKIIREFYQK